MYESNTYSTRPYPLTENPEVKLIDVEEGKFYVTMGDSLLVKIQGKIYWHQSLHGITKLRLWHCQDFAESELVIPVKRIVAEI